MTLSHKNSTVRVEVLMFDWVPFTELFTFRKPHTPRPQAPNKTLVYRNIVRNRRAHLETLVADLHLAPDTVQPILDQLFAEGSVNIRKRGPLTVYCVEYD